MVPPKGDKPPKPKKRRGRPPKVKADDLPLEELAAAESGEPEPTPPPEPEPASSPPRDNPPGNVSDAEPRRPRRARVTKKGTQQIEDALAEILQIPAVPAAVFGDHWMAEHFTVQGRAFANRIATVSERNPVLRAWCEKALEGESVAVLLMAGVMYAAPPLMHFGVIPGAEMLGVPKLVKNAPPPTPGMEPHPSGGLGADEVPAKQWGGEPTEGPPPATEMPTDSTDEVVPDLHFAGGDAEEFPPVFMEQMVGQ